MRQIALPKSHSLAFFSAVDSIAGNPGAVHAWLLAPSVRVSDRPGFQTPAFNHLPIGRRIKTFTCRFAQKVSKGDATEPIQTISAMASPSAAVVAVPPMSGVRGAAGSASTCSIARTIASWASR